MGSSTDSRSSGPHQRIATRSEQERFTAELFDRLWARYRDRVSYVAVYEQVVQDAGATFVNDHIAFRTFATQRPASGIFLLGRLFESLGFQAAGTYQFPDKQLSAIHFQHSHPEFPKLFVSELQVWRLPRPAQEMIQEVVASHREPLHDDVLHELAQLEQADSRRREELLQQLTNWFEQLPWELPEKPQVVRLNEFSQYAAWVAVHGYNVNHFTALINSHGAAELDDLEKTIEALRRQGVPMKAEIEGARGSKLRQSATEAVRIDVDVREQGQPARMPWTYAYFELAERGQVVDPETGRAARFEGFLGAQATHLFEMTRVR